MLGAQDPEMREIERVLDDAGIERVHAAKGRRRCSPKTAYQADGVVDVGADHIPRPALLLPRQPAVFVECTARAYWPGRSAPGTPRRATS